MADDSSSKPEPPDPALQWVRITSPVGEFDVHVSRLGSLAEGEQEIEGYPRSSVARRDKPHTDLAGSPVARKAATAAEKG